MNGIVGTEYWTRNHDVPSSNGATLRVVEKQQDGDYRYAVAWTGSDVMNGGNLIDGNHNPVIISDWNSLNTSIIRMDELASMDAFTLHGLVQKQIKEAPEIF